MTLLKLGLRSGHPVSFLLALINKVILFVNVFIATDAKGTGCGWRGQAALHFGGTEPENGSPRRSILEFGLALPSILRLCGLAIRVWLSLFGPHPCCKNKCFSRSVSSMVLTEGRVRGKAKEGLWTASCLVGFHGAQICRGAWDRDAWGRGRGCPGWGPPALVSELYRGFVNSPGHQSLLGNDVI